MTAANILSEQPVIPSTILGLIAVISGYVYYYYRNKDKNEVEKIKAMPVAQRANALQGLINELGIQISTADLSTDQRFELVKRMMRLKTTKWLITSVTFIILTIIASILLSKNPEVNEPPIAVDKGKKQDSIDIKPKQDSIKTGWIIRNVDKLVSVQFPGKPDETDHGGLSFRDRDNDIVYQVTMVDFTDSTQFPPIKTPEKFASIFRDAFQKEIIGLNLPVFTIAQWKGNISYKASGVDGNKSTYDIFMFMIKHRLYSFTTIRGKDSPANDIIRFFSCIKMRN